MLILVLPLQGAVCLDGSPPGYYFRPGKDLNKWILHLQGGGWCDHGTEDCYNRSFTKLGSSANWTSSQDFHGALSSNVDITPFYNWNMVFLNYCDGASFAGDRLVKSMSLSQNIIIEFDALITFSLQVYNSYLHGLY